MCLRECVHVCVCTGVHVYAHVYLYAHIYMDTKNVYHTSKKVNCHEFSSYRSDCGTMCARARLCPTLLRTDTVLPSVIEEVSSTTTVVAVQ